MNVLYAENEWALVAGILFIALFFLINLRTLG